MKYFSNRLYVSGQILKNEKIGSSEPISAFFGFDFKKKKKLREAQVLRHVACT